MINFKDGDLIYVRDSENEPWSADLREFKFYDKAANLFVVGSDDSPDTYFGFRYATKTKFDLRKGQPVVVWDLNSGFPKQLRIFSHFEANTCITRDGYSWDCWEPLEGFDYSIVPSYELE